VAADAIRLSRATLRTIKQNLAWAFGYNVAALPVAAAGCRAPRWMTTLASFGVRMWRVAKSPALGRA